MAVSTRARDISAIVLLVIAGAAVGGVVHDTGAFGLDAAFPAVLLALVVPILSRRTRDAAILGAVLALVATPFLPPGLPVLVALGGLVLRRDPAETSDRAVGS